VAPEGGPTVFPGRVSMIGTTFSEGSPLVIPGGPLAYTVGEEWKSVPDGFFPETVLWPASRGVTSPRAWITTGGNQHRWGGVVGGCIWLLKNTTQDDV